MADAEVTPSTSEIKEENGDLKTDPDQKAVIEKDRNELQYFECSVCTLREKYEYFGKAAPFLKRFVLLEDSYVIEDPFVAPKQGEALILGSHCNMCSKMVCKDPSCSIYYNRTFCINCAKLDAKSFPKVVQEKN